MEQLTLQVEGMSCGHCVNSIEGSVKELNGVEQVKVQLAEGTVEVTIDSSVVTLKDIVAVIEDQGYDVQ
ncbi:MULTISPECIES: copper chaperone CopZ [Bacillus]|uniref:Copper chaperone CopZ n=1 Tax=Bacillus cereus TaxID=1396 RepID=A0A2B3UP82_BACCE|nr:copper chaperone CopZ [Bacillus cereus]PFL18273.1 copper resistance protein CopZ [Bacillus cereus]PFU48645.1 copper resistance protein CopZ [Bacillus cereus]